MRRGYDPRGRGRAGKLLNTTGSGMTVEKTGRGRPGSPEELQSASPRDGEPGCPQPGLLRTRVVLDPVLRSVASWRERGVPMNLLAYHITWGTYGTRLHGDPRKTVDRQHNAYGEPILGY